jgi:hypothetical protein
LLYTWLGCQRSFFGNAPHRREMPSQHQAGPRSLWRCETQNPRWPPWFFPCTYLTNHPAWSSQVFSPPQQPHICSTWFYNSPKSNITCKPMHQSLSLHKPCNLVGLYSYSIQRTPKGGPQIRSTLIDPALWIMYVHGQVGMFVVDYDQRAQIKDGRPKPCPDVPKQAS